MGTGKCPPNHLSPLPHGSDILLFTIDASFLKFLELSSWRLARFGLTNPNPRWETSVSEALREMKSEDKLVRELEGSHTTLGDEFKKRNVAFVG